MKRAAAYARYSSDVQSDTSIEAQLEKIRLYCQQHGYEVVKEYVDRAVSAATDKRPAFQQMIKDAEKRKFDVVVVYKLDRFARNLYDSVVYTKKLEDAGVELESATEPITHGIAGKFFRNIMSAINELYVENLKQELKDKAIVVAKKGYHMGGLPPFGYKLEEAKDEYGKRRKKYVINEEEAKIVRQIFEWAARGDTLRAIADRLNAIGVKTRTGGEWRVNSLYDLLRNKKYIGIFTYNRGTKHNYHAKRNDVIEVPGAIPPIISMELWEQVRKRFPVRSPRSRCHSYPLKGILVCGVCGSPMSAGTGGSYPSYMCLKAKREHLKGH
ncbi:MAG: recombinase family protein, partial [Thermotogaceae bacterium]|nr:recombinase family protein [Thermotogaceae bacterium]